MSYPTFTAYAKSTGEPITVDDRTFDPDHHTRTVPSGVRKVAKADAYDPAQYDDATLSQLRASCMARFLDPAGSREVLIVRLKAQDFDLADRHDVPEGPTPADTARVQAVEAKADAHAAAEAKADAKAEAKAAKDDEDEDEHAKKRRGR